MQKDNVMKIDLQPRYRVLLEQDKPITLVLIGVGGTGSALAVSLARIAYHVQSKGAKLSIVFIDPDTIVEKNLGRQFAPSDVGWNKAETMAARLGVTFGLRITAIPEAFVARTASDFVRYESHTLLIGAVDNAAARAQIARAVQTYGGKVWALDTGNDHHSGQACIGNLDCPTWRRQVKLSPLGLCSGLPSPYVQMPDLLIPEPTVQDKRSCAELVITEEQSLVVNQAMAALAAQYIYRFVVMREISWLATYFNLEPPTARTTPITAKAIRKIQCD